MSGGVDSMSLISIAKNVFDYDVHGFTIVNEDERYEENDMIEHAKQTLGVRHTADPHRHARLPARSCASSCATTTPRSTRSPTSCTGC